jgi:hypothetical protein
MNEDDLWPWEIDWDNPDGPIIYYCSNADKLKEHFDPSKLPWSRYLWCVMSTRNDESKVMVYGTIGLEQPPSDVTLRTRVLGTAAKTAREIGVTWDPFNVSCLIKPAERQDAE